MKGTVYLTGRGAEIVEGEGRLRDFVLHFTCHCSESTRNFPNGQSQGSRGDKRGDQASRVHSQTPKMGLKDGLRIRRSFSAKVHTIKARFILVPNQ